jgi:hypothetical protein
MHRVMTTTEALQHAKCKGWILEEAVHGSPREIMRKVTPPGSSLRAILEHKNPGPVVLPPCRSDTPEVVVPVSPVVLSPPLLPDAEEDYDILQQPNSEEAAACADLENQKKIRPPQPPASKTFLQRFWPF